MPDANEPFSPLPQRRVARRGNQHLVSPGRLIQHQPVRRPAWIDQTPQAILERYRPGKAEPLHVLEVLLELFNTQHTALQKTVSHKTRQERAQLLRRFFRDLKDKAGFKTIPDPRNLGQRHIQAMVQLWQRAALAPATIQTYLSFLRGLSLWLGKPGFIRNPAHYGLSPDEYQRHENASKDKSCSALGIDATDLIARVCTFDAHVGASLKLMHAFGLRRKESVQMRPYEHVQPFACTRLPDERRDADDYLWVKGKGGRVRWIPIQSALQQEALEFARGVVGSPAAPVGDPARDLCRNLRRLNYVLERFDITRAASGATAHGLRHQMLNDVYETETGIPAPVRGGSAVPPDIDKAARLKVSALAGHARMRAAGAYVGSRPRISRAGTEDAGQRQDPAD